MGASTTCVYIYARCAAFQPHRAVHIDIEYLYTMYTYSVRTHARNAHGAWQPSAKAICLTSELGDGV